MQNVKKETHFPHNNDKKSSHKWMPKKNINIKKINKIFPQKKVNNSNINLGN